VTGFQPCPLPIFDPGGAGGGGAPAGSAYAYVLLEAVAVSGQALVFAALFATYALSLVIKANARFFTPGIVAEGLATKESAGAFQSLWELANGVGKHYGHTGRGQCDQCIDGEAKRLQLDGTRTHLECKPGGNPADPERGGHAGDHISIAPGRGGTFATRLQGRCRWRLVGYRGRVRRHSEFGDNCLRCSAFGLCQSHFPGATLLIRETPPSAF
jgi:hypothetical protein